MKRPRIAILACLLAVSCATESVPTPTDIPRPEPTAPPASEPAATAVPTLTPAPTHTPAPAVAKTALPGPTTACSGRRSAPPLKPSVS